uniref:Uncharacterized protein n=1 Tax=Arundo donax TaxID=35708 RepID=A0A0A9BK68_ARUDO
MSCHILKSEHIKKTNIVQFIWMESLEFTFSCVIFSHKSHSYKCLELRYFDGA